MTRDELIRRVAILGATFVFGALAVILLNATETELER